MRVNWNQKRENGQVVYTGRYGLIHFEYTVKSDGQVPYAAYIRSSGKRIPIIKVVDNPEGEDQIDAQARLEFIGACLDNYLLFDLLNVEKLSSSIVNLDRRPLPNRLNEILGLFVNRTYLYDGGRGKHFYRVYSIMNNSPKNDSRDILVGYRDIFTGEEWGCVIDKFSSEKYKVVAIGTNVEAPHDFKHTTVCAQRIAYLANC